MLINTFNYFQVIRITHKNFIKECQMTKIPVGGAAAAATAAGRKKYFKHRLKIRIYFCSNRA